MGATVLPKPEPARVRSVAQMAAEPAIAEALKFFSAQKKWILERHIEICRIPAPTFQEQPRAEWLAGQFRALGCDARIDRAGNVIASPGSIDGPVTAVTAHLDTVLEPLSPDDIRAGRDGELRGPGVSDNGAGLAALLAIAAAIKQTRGIAQSTLPLLLVANVGEEGEGNLSGMRYLCRPAGIASRVHSFLVLDGPFTDHITTRALASRRFEILFTGPGGHSWSDHGLPNPVHALGRTIALFTENPNNGNQAGRVSYNFGLIEGGTSVNSIPTTARAKLDLRSENAARIDEMASLLTACVEHALEAENERSSGPRLSAKIREIGSRPGGQLPDDAPILAHLRAVDAHLGIRAQVDCASTDANIPLSLGMQAVSIGAGGHGGGAHTPSEWFRADGRENGLRRIFLTLCLLMRDIDAGAAR
jgi:acetylornithine deacetylase/succinyl-diaminopimelate desuccinylase-like protein